MTETLGMLDLKIAKLENQLHLLIKQQALSRAYPAHLADLSQRGAQTRAQLRQLIQRRAELLQYNYAMPS